MCFEIGLAERPPVPDCAVLSVVKLVIRDMLSFLVYTSFPYGVEGEMCDLL